jgi:hypothetical protein
MVTEWVKLSDKRILGVKIANDDAMYSDRMFVNKEAIARGSWVFR